MSLKHSLIASSNYLYNEGLRYAHARDLSKGEDCLIRALKINKSNIDARNLLGLIYYEKGEWAHAIEEWSISRALRPYDNIADEYMDALLSGAGREKVSQTIKKYNTALGYCHGGGTDIAMLQIKNVLNMNPNFVKALQVSALLYAKEGKYDKARMELKKALRIDRSDPDTLRILKGIDQKRKDQQNKRKPRKESISYRSGNETIIQPLSGRVSSPVTMALNILLGVAIGALLVYFLAVPGIRASLMNKAQTIVKEANEKVTADDAQMSALNDKISSLEESIAAYESADAENEEILENYRHFILCLKALSDEDDETMEEELLLVDESLLSGDALTVYESVKDAYDEEMLKSLYAAGVKSLKARDYESAIESLLAAYKIDKTYEDGWLIYYLAQSYDKNGNTDNALKMYNKVVSLYAGTTVASYSQKYIDNLEED